VTIFNQEKRRVIFFSCRKIIAHPISSKERGFYVRVQFGA
jgi:hypothetical protein